MEPPLLEPDDIKFLTEVGFLAAARGDVRRAEAVFAAMRLVRPRASSPYVGLALALVNAGRPDDAVRELDTGLSAARDDETRADVNAFRGLVLQLAGRASESVRALRSAGPHPLAQAMLGEREAATVNAIPGK